MNKKNSAISDKIRGIANKISQISTKNTLIICSSICLVVILSLILYFYSQLSCPTPTYEDVTKCEYVDLGLPSGTLWATCNIGAESEWEEGNYYLWDKTTDIRNRMPSKDQIAELIDKCTFESIYGKGLKVTGPNGNSICFPHTCYGGQWGDDLYSSMDGCYWSSTPNTVDDVYILDIVLDYDARIATTLPHYRLPIRPVKSSKNQSAK